MQDDRGRRRRLRAAGALTAALAMIGAVTMAGGGAAGADSNTIEVLRPGNFDFSGTVYGGHNVFRASGIQVTTDNSDNAEAAGLFAVNAPLAAVGEPSLQWTQTGSPDATPPATLLAVDFDGDGTLDGYLFGEPAYHGDWWAAGDPDLPDFVKAGAPSCNPGPCTGGSGSAYHGTLDAWRAAFPSATVESAGYNLGTGVQNSGLLNSETVGDTTYFFTKFLISTRTIGQEDFVQALSDTRATGHLVFNRDNLHVFTEGATGTDKVAEYWPLDTPLPLIHAGQPVLDWNGSATPPGTQLVVDFDNDGTPDGILVGEPKFYGQPYGDDFWLNNAAEAFVKAKAPSCFDVFTGDPLPGGCTGGSGSPYHGLLAEWATVFPNAKILYAGFSLGSGVLGDGIINSIDVGNTEFVFANTPPTAADITKSTGFGQPVSIDLTATDPNTADTLTYEVGAPSHGTISGTAPSITYTPDAGFAGVDSFTYTVSDGVNAPVTGTVTVTVGKADAALDVAFQPTPRTSADRVHVLVTVETDGNPDGGTVSVDVGKVGGHIYTALVSGGTADVVIGKYDAGMHHARITFSGTDNTADAATGANFTVHKVATELGITTDPAHIKTTTKNGQLIVTVTSPGVSTRGTTVTVKHLGSAVVKHDVATIDLPKLSAGDHSYTAKYSGNARSAAATQDFVIHVTKG